MKRKIEKAITDKGFEFEFVRENYSDYRYKVKRGDFEREVNFSKDGNPKMQMDIIFDTYKMVSK